jgi:hypothetical protein
MAAAKLAFRESNTAPANREEAFTRTVEMMRQYFSLADFLPVGVDGTAGLNDLPRGKRVDENGYVG